MTTIRTTTALRVLAVVAAFGLLAACGDDAADDTGPASLGAGAADEAEEASADDEEMDPEDAAVAFAECMRENGVEMETPEVGEDGGLGISIGSDGGDGPSPEEIDAAHDECEDLLPEMGGEREPLDPDEVAERRDQTLALAECMRDRGYDFPDPQVDDNGGVRIEGPDLGGPDETDADEFDTDMAECHEEAGMEAPGMGGPAGGGGFSQTEQG